MIDTNNQEEPTTPEESGETEVETISIPKSDYEKLNQTIGSMKRELKDFKKSKEETVIETKTGTFGLLEKSYLRSAGVVGEEEMELAKSIQKKTGLDWDALVDDDYFKSKLDSFRAKKANELATSNIKGGQGESGAKYTPEYWLAKGVPPSREEVPDRKSRVKIARAFMTSTKSGKKFYND